MTKHKELLLTSSKTGSGIGWDWKKKNQLVQLGIVHDSRDSRIWTHQHPHHHEASNWHYHQWTKAIHRSSSMSIDCGKIIVACSFRNFQWWVMFLSIIAGYSLWNMSSGLPPPLVGPLLLCPQVHSGTGSPWPREGIMDYKSESRNPSLVWGILKANNLAL